MSDKINQIQTKQLATPVNDPYEHHIRTAKQRFRLQHKDSLLQNTGLNDARAVELYLDTVTDDQVYSSWDKQMTEIEARDWHIKPSGDTKKAKNIAAFVEDVLLTLEMNEKDQDDGLSLATTSSGYEMLLRTLGLGILSGISPSSVSWVRRKGNYYPIIKAFDPARILFESGPAGQKIYPKLLTRRHYTEGIMLPPRSAMIYRYWAIPNGDPYGYGLGRFIYNLTEWRREGIIRHLNILDKYSDAVKDGSYPEGACEEDITNFKNALRSLGTDGTIIHPETFKIGYYNPPSSISDIVDGFREFVSSAVSKIITGEAVTGEKDATTTYVRDKVSNSIRIIKAQGWSKSFDSFLNRTLIKWIVELNFPGEKPPLLVTEWVDVEAKIGQLERLKNLGFTADKAELQELVDVMAKKKKTPSKKFNFPS